MQENNSGKLANINLHCGVKKRRQTEKQQKLSKNNKNCPKTTKTVQKLNKNHGTKPAANLKEVSMTT